MNRQEQIAKGKLWQVYPDSNREDIRFEGTRTQCLSFLRSNSIMRDYRKGTMRIGKVIWEATLKLN